MRYKIFDTVMYDDGGPLYPFTLVNSYMSLEEIFDLFEPKELVDFYLVLDMDANEENQIKYELTVQRPKNILCLKKLEKER